MQETSDLAYAQMSAYIKDNSKEYLKNILLPTIKKDSPALRPAIFRFAYQLGGGEDWKQHLNCAAAFEILNLSTYSFSNLIDDKIQDPLISSKERRGKNTLEGLLQLSLALEMITHESFKLSRENHKCVTDRIFKLSQELCEGVFIDSQKLCSFDSFTLDAYLDRCYGMSGSFIQAICEVSALFAGADQNKIEQLGEFGKNLGLILQIINDIADFIPPAPHSEPLKSYKEQFSDLRSGTITLPAFLIYKSGESNGKKVLNRVFRNAEPDFDDLLYLSNCLVECGGLTEIKKLTHGLAKLGRKALKNFEKSTSRNWLTMTLGISKRNLFFKKLQEIPSIQKNY